VAKCFITVPLNRVLQADHHPYTDHRTTWYRDSAGNTVEQNSSVFSLIRMR